MDGEAVDGCGVSTIIDDGDGVDAEVDDPTHGDVKFGKQRFTIDADVLPSHETCVNTQLLATLLMVQTLQRQEGNANQV